MQRRTCYKCKKRKAISKFGRNKMYLTLGARDGINIYCKECRRRDVAAKRAEPEANKVKKPIVRKEMCIAARRAAKNMSSVLQAIQIGLHSRESIKEHTKLDMNTVVDTLALLAFETEQLRIVRKGEDAEFHLAA